MLRARCFPAFYTIAVTATVLAGAGRVRAAEHSGALTEVPLPGGLRAALTAINDRVAPDRSQFLREFIRRTYQMPAGPRSDLRDAFHALLAHLEFAARANGAERPVTAETLPLPLTPEIWIDVVFGGRASRDTLVADILRTREASLLYYGLLSLDDDTRAWLATKPGLIAELATQHAATFVVAAPGLRVVNGSMRLPGGEAAQPGWEALVGRRAAEPAEFLRAIVADRERRLPYFLTAMAQLTPVQATYALRLHHADESARADAIRRMQNIFQRLAPGWKLDERPFWRPASDPALLVGDLPADGDGRPVLVGTRRFWAATFSDHEVKAGRDEDARALVEGEPADFVWLCEQLFASDQRRRYPLVLFASRLLPQVTPESVVDAVDAVRAAGQYPALVATLERANIRDVRVFAAAARRAAHLSSIADDGRAARALTQFQAALAIVTRAARRGGLARDVVPGLVTSLSAVEVSSRGEYEGRMVRWLDTVLVHLRSADEQDENAPDAVERALVGMLAGAAAPAPPAVEWEGTRYRLDLRHAEVLRLARLLGSDSPPYISLARGLVDAADVLTSKGLTRERLAREVAAIERVARAAGGESEATLQRLTRAADLRDAARIASALRLAADAMLARGLIELTYAVALGHPDRAAILASDAAGRHDFGLGLNAIRRLAPWRFPAAGTGVGREWHVTGSLLGLDVKLAEFSLVAVSAKPPLRRPSVLDEDRRVFIEAVGLAEPSTLTDADRDAIITAVRAGRDRLAAIRTRTDAAALAEEIGLSGARRSLLDWSVTHDRDGLPNVFSHGELLALGSAKGPLPATLHAWGAAAETRLGCLCLQLFERRPWQSVEGRWNSGSLASAFPDLSLRLAELLGELRMPAALMPAVLAPAMLDFINTAECRDPDDRRGLLDFVQRLRLDRVEQYLALLTSDGPLVPITDGSSEGGR